MGSLSIQVLAYLMVTSLAAAVEFVYLAYNGDQVVSWSSGCGSYGKFCTRLAIALGLHVIGVVCFLVLAVLSAYRLFRKFDPPFLPSKDHNSEPELIRSWILVLINCIVYLLFLIITSYCILYSCVCSNIHFIGSGVVKNY